MNDSNLERILAVVRRELGAHEALVIPPTDRVDSERANTNDGSDDDEPTDARTLQRTLPDGRTLVVRYAEPPVDRPARETQLDLLINSFAATLHSQRPSAPPPPGRLLCDELAGLCERAGAVAAAVIDAHSPVVWASSLSDVPGPVPDAADPALGADAARFLARRLNLPTVDLDATPVDPAVIALVPAALCRELGVYPVARENDALVLAAADPGNDELLARVSRVAGSKLSPRVAARAAVERAIDRAYGPEPGMERVRLLERAVSWTRDLPEMPELHRGATLRAHVREEDYSAIARSFATIYLLVVAFDRANDEIATERALSHALPTIERLVAALPPMDPAPGTAGVVALRSARRRR